MEPLHADTNQSYAEVIDTLAARIGGDEEEWGVTFDAAESTFSVSLGESARDFIGMGGNVRCLIGVDADLGCAVRVRPYNVFDRNARYFLITPRDDAENNPAPLIREVSLSQPYNRKQELIPQLVSGAAQTVPDEIGESLVASLIQ